MNTTFKKSITMVVAAASIGATLAASAAPASAKPWKGGGFNHGGAIAAGLIGAIAVGAIASQAYGNGGCYFERQPVYNSWGDVVGYRRIRVCN